MTHHNRFLEMQSDPSLYVSVKQVVKMMGVNHDKAGQIINSRYSGFPENKGFLEKRFFLKSEVEAYLRRHNVKEIGFLDRIEQENRPFYTPVSLLWKSPYQKRFRRIQFDGFNLSGSL